MKSRNAINGYSLYCPISGMRSISWQYQLLFLRTLNATAISIRLTSPRLELIQQSCLPILILWPFLHTRCPAPVCISLAPHLLHFSCLLAWSITEITTLIQRARMPIENNPKFGDTTSMPPCLWCSTSSYEILSWATNII